MHNSDDGRSRPLPIVSICRTALGCLLTGLLTGETLGCTNYLIQRPAINETFDSGAQDWQVSEGVIGSYRATGGNPGGYVSGTDNAIGFWYFISSPAFVNELKKRYGRTLQFDLVQSATDNQADADDVILTDGINKLTFKTTYNPKITWTHYAVPLDDVSGWKKGKSKATKADLQTVLKNLAELRIRGEFRAGPDQGGIDNVAIQ